MKVTCAYYLLLLYSIAMCKSMVPFIKDITAHAFWKVEHLSAVHDPHGEHHVHNEIKEAAKDNDKSNTAKTLKNVEPVSIHIISNVNEGLIDVYKVVNVFPLKKDYLQSRFLEINSPPPKV